MEGDVVRLIALAAEPIIRNLDDVITNLDRVISSRSKGLQDI